MKKNISLILSSIIFITQSWSLNLMAQENDIRLKLASDIDQAGEKLQAIQDREGTEAAHQAFRALAKENLKKRTVASITTINAMSDEEASRYIDMMKKTRNLSSSDEMEGIDSIFSNRSLSNKQKLMALQDDKSDIQFGKAIEEIIERAAGVGYQKAFQEVTDHVRSRSYMTSQDGNAMVFILLSFIFGFFAVIIPPPLVFYFLAPVAILMIFVVIDSVSSAGNEEW